MTYGPNSSPMSEALGQQRFRVGPWTVDPQTNEISSDGRSAKLEPKVMALLVYLAERPGRTVSRDELLDAIWGGTAVVEEALTRCVSQLRRALDDDPQTPRYIQTVSKRGYRLVALVLIDKAHRFEGRELTPASASQAKLSIVPAASPPARIFYTHTFAWMSAVAAVAAIVATFALWRSSPAPRPSVARFVLTLPEGERLAEAPGLAISGDGGLIAYVTLRDGTRRLFLRRISEVQAMPVMGSVGADQPFFSPDGQWIAFFADRKLKKAPISGGAPVVICDVGVFRGGTWLADDTIVFGTSNTGLFRVAAAGGSPIPMTQLQGAEGSHRWPQALPGGQALLYAIGPAVTSTGWNEAHIVAQSLATGARHTLVPRGTFPRYAAGRLLYVLNGSLMAVSLDPSRLEVTDAPAPLGESVQMGGLNGGASGVDVSTTGTLVYVVGTDRDDPYPVWVDRLGNLERIPIPSQGGRVSPDGTRIAYTRREPQTDIWVYDLTRRTSTKVTDGGTNQWPLWTPDGKRITFVSTRTGSARIFWTPADGSKAEEPLTTTQYAHAPRSWSPDGRMLLFDEVLPTNGAAMWLLPIATRKPEMVLGNAPIEFQGTFSPNGRLIAYTANYSGRNEVYVRDISGSGPRIQVSADGGQEPVWNRNGRELFFRRDNDMMVVDVQIAGTFSAGAPRKLFSGSFVQGPWITSYDVTPDGKRFLMAAQEATGPSQVTVVLNWTSTIGHKSGE